MQMQRIEVDGEQVAVRLAGELDAGALRAHVVETWHSEAVVAHGEQIYPARLPGFVAFAGERIVGHVSYRVAGEDCEITSIDATPRRAGIGSLLLDVAVAAAREEGCRRVWLTTTNDNLDALRFYQRRGFRLCALRADALAYLRRTLKPELPDEGSYGITMRDELDLELDLTAPDGP
jgi:ribosomal protein S18 acetylase RimI-like enzyme